MRNQPKTYVERDLRTGEILDVWENVLNPRVVQLANDVLRRHHKPFKWFLNKFKFNVESHAHYHDDGSS